VLASRHAAVLRAGCLWFAGLRRALLT